MKQKLFYVPALIFIGGICIILIWHKGLLEHLAPFNSGYRFETIDAHDRGYAKTHEFFLLLNDYTDQSGKKTEVLSLLETIGDDFGLYYYLTVVKSLLGDNCDTYTAYLIISLCIIILGFLISSFGLILLFKNKLNIIISIVSTGLLSLFCVFILDVYISVFLPLSFIPIFLSFIKESTQEKFKKLLFIIPIVGFLIGFTDKFRIYSGIGILLFIAISLLLHYKKIGFKKVILLLLILFSTSQIQNFHFNNLLNSRNKWLEVNNYDINSFQKDSKHVIWHALYLGLAFTPNKYGIIWDDNFAFNKAQQINKKVKMNSAEYEKIIKNEYINILKKDQFFILKTYLLKFIYVILFLLILFNLNTYFIFIKRLSYKKTLPFIISIAFYATPAILVWPYPMYFLGSLFLTLLFGSLIMEECLNGTNK